MNRPECWRSSRSLSHSRRATQLSRRHFYRAIGWRVEATGTGRLLGCQYARRGQTAPNHITEKVTSCCTTLNLLAKLITNMWPSSRKPYYALNPVRLFVRPSVCPLPADDLKTENHTTFKFRGQVTPTSGITYRRKKQLAVEQVWGQKIKGQVTGAETHVASTIGTTLTVIFIVIIVAVVVINIFYLLCSV